MLGAKQPLDFVPFFWSQHYDQTISYVGHAALWGRLEIFGDPITGSSAVTYYINVKKLAVSTLGRDIQNLCVEISCPKQIRNIK